MGRRLATPSRFPRQVSRSERCSRGYTKQHSAEVQAQAIIDLAFQMRDLIPSLDEIREIVLHTSYHTHNVIGTGANDPQKYSPDASRETLDHSVMYIFAVALTEGRWHHVESYRRERVTDRATIKLWQSIRTVEDAAWTAGYHHPDPMQRVYGARTEVILNDGTRIVGELDRPHTHIAGAKPFDRNQYLAKFHSLTDEMIAREESTVFSRRHSCLRNSEAGSWPASIYPSRREGS